jgi:tripartite-type tricarboxylate transporter receptor subunit TctC
MSLFSSSLRTAACVTVTVSVSLAFAASAALADVYPSKPITLIVGYPPGGSTDLVARTVAPKLSEKLGQPVVIENLGGAGGTLGAQKMISASADGYTLLLGSNNEVVIAKLINKAVRYDPQKDLLPVGLIGSQPMVLVGRANLAPKTADELVAFAKQPGAKLSFASSGVGTALHLAGEMVNQQAGTNILHVPYKGAAPMVSDVLGGNIELAVFVLSSAMPHIKSGAMRAYGITETKRNAIAPDIPTLNESKALAGVDISSWFGLFAPAKTPDPVMKRLNAALADVLALPDVKTKLTEAGVTLMAEPADRATSVAKTFITSDTARIEKVVRAAKIEL